MKLFAYGEECIKNILNFVANIRSKVCQERKQIKISYIIALIAEFAKKFNLGSDRHTITLSVLGNRLL